MNSGLELVQTSDGSHTFYHPHIGEHYHSRHGAVQESQHVFVNSGFKHLQELSGASSLAVLEVGFGTGLNFLLTADHCLNGNIALHYTGIEAWPLSPGLIEHTSYSQYLSDTDLWEHFRKNYIDSFAEATVVKPGITLQIAETPLLDFHTPQQFDLIYFDAFAAVHQPEMWTHESIQHACSFLKDKGIFVTYSVTGNLKRILRSLGFSIERPAGAAGKREMMRATLHKA